VHEPGLKPVVGVKPHYFSRCHWSVGRVQPSQLILILRSGPFHGISFTRPDGGGVRPVRIYADAVQCGSVGNATLLFEHRCEVCSHVICSGGMGSGAGG